MTIDIDPPGAVALTVRRPHDEPADDDPTAILAWADERFGDDLVVTASFGDATLVHLVASHLPGTEIALIDTGYLFAETLWYAETLRTMLDLNLTIVHPRTGPGDVDRWQHDPGGCCAARKVEPLDRLLRDRSAWVTGLRRADGPTRATTPAASYDPRRAITKINPLVAMSDDDVDEYHRAHGLPRHPLSDRGFPSIGCWPCTRPVEPGEDPRAGRWSGTTKTECGLHL